MQTIAILAPFGILTTHGDNVGFQIVPPLSGLEDLNRLNRDGNLPVAELLGSAAAAAKSHFAFKRPTCSNAPAAKAKSQARAKAKAKGKALARHAP